MSGKLDSVRTVWWFPLKSMKYHQETGKPLSVEWMRGEAWIAHCLKIAGVKAVSRLPDVLGNAVAVSEDSFRAYKSAREPAKDMTIELVNRALPGTRATWDSGPDGLPIWPVLWRDIGACKALVDDELANHTDRPDWSLLTDRNNPIRDMSLLERAQALLEATLPSHYWTRRYWDLPKDRWESLVDESDDECKASTDLGRFKRQYRDVSFLSLDELVRLEPNVLAEAYVEGAKRAKTAMGRFGFAEYRYITSPRRVLALLALGVLLNNGSDAFSKDVAYYIGQGIDQALSEHFGTALQKYVTENFN